MHYYPVIIPTLNRFMHFKNCVESLSRCTHADKTELVIGLDYPPSEKYEEGYQKIKKFIPTISGFAKVTVFEHKENLGPDGNWQYLVEYCNQHYDAYIGTEDDNVFAPAFFDYMDKALEMFRDDERIVSVSGYNFVDAYNQGFHTCYLSRDNCAWGTGYWLHKEKKLRIFLLDNDYFINAIYSRPKAKKIVNTYPALYSMLNNMVQQGTEWGDVMRTIVNILEDKYQLKPAISLVRNCGYDGSGIHCGNDNRGLSNQIISEEKKFSMFEVGPAETKANEIALSNNALSADINERKAQKRAIFKQYSFNTSLSTRVKRICNSLRVKLAIRTRVKNLFHYN